MRRLLALFVFVCSSAPAFAMPQFLQLYRSDPFRNPAVDGCITCHMSPQGGDARNAFGQAFENGGETITPMLRAQFPDRFVFPTSRAGGAMTIYFSDPENKQIVVESAGVKNLVDAANKTVNGSPAATANAAAAPAAQTFASRSGKPEIPVDTYSREGAYFGSNIVNLSNGKPLKQGEVDFLIGHRFGQDVKSAGFDALGGFDSFATITFGGRVGLTNRLSVGVQRSNYFRNAQDQKQIEFNSALQISRQSDSVPITLQGRAGIEGAQNFHSLYRPFVQLVATRTFKDRVSFTLEPTFAFNTRNSQTFTAPELLYGANHKNTQALGVGVGIRFLPTASIVGEYIPRLGGFRGERKDYAGLSVGLQKSTNRHTFELVVGRQEVMTVAEYAFQGTDTFRIGFNIYRRIR